MEEEEEGLANERQKGFEFEVKEVNGESESVAMLR